MQKINKAIREIPECVELAGGEDWEHIVFRVEHPVCLYDEGEDFYSAEEAGECRRWLRKYAPKSPYARKR